MRKFGKLTWCLAFRVELNLANGTYELHPAPEEGAVADLSPVGAEPEQAEDLFATSPREGDVDASELAATVT